DARRTVGIVFHGRDHRRYGHLVALEIHHPVRLLGAAADEPRGDAAGTVAPAGALLGLHQRLLRTVPGNVFARHHRLEAPRRGDRSVSLDGHLRSPRNRASSRPSSTSRRPSSTSSGSPRTFPGAATFRRRWLSALP